MKQTLIIYLDKTGKSTIVVTPYAQGPEFDAKTRFDGNWFGLAQALTKGNYVKFEVI